MIYPLLQYSFQRLSFKGGGRPFVLFYISNTYVYYCFYLGYLMIFLLENSQTKTALYKNGNKMQKFFVNYSLIFFIIFISLLVGSFFLSKLLQYNNAFVFIVMRNENCQPSHTHTHFNPCFTLFLALVSKLLDVAHTHTQLGSR